MGFAKSLGKTVGGGLRCPEGWCWVWGWVPFLGFPLVVPRSRSWGRRRLELICALPVASAGCRGQCETSAATWARTWYRPGILLERLPALDLALVLFHLGLDRSGRYLTSHRMDLCVFSELPNDNKGGCKSSPNN